MDRINAYIIVVFVANILCWSYLSIDEIADNKEYLTSQIVALKESVKQKQEIADKASKIRESLNEINVITPSAMLDKLRQTAQLHRFEITQAINKGGFPPIICISGTGNYRSFSALLNELSKNELVHIDRVKVEKTDEGIVSASFEASVKSDIWSKNKIEGELQEIRRGVRKHSVVGQRDMFGSYIPPVKPPMPRPNIKYLGYYAGKASPTIILEDRLRAVLMKVGETTPGGSVLIKADNMNIEIKDKRGITWKFKMKK